MLEIMKAAKSSKHTKIRNVRTESSYAVVFHPLTHVHHNNGIPYTY